MKRDAAEWLEPSWNTVLLVCKDCRKRGSGPAKSLKTKDVVNELRNAYRHVDGVAKPRPRVMLTSCTGLCPKRALVVIAADGSAPLRTVAVASLTQLRDAVPLLQGSAKPPSG